MPIIAELKLRSMKSKFYTKRCTDITKIKIKTKYNYSIPKNNNIILLASTLILEQSNYIEYNHVVYKSFKVAIGINFGTDSNIRVWPAGTGFFPIFLSLSTKIFTQKQRLTVIFI